MLANENIMNLPYWKKLQDPRWQKRRLEILQRDNFTCRACGSKDKTLHVHHDFYQGDPWEAPGPWLHTLCWECHEERAAVLACIKEELKYFIARISMEGLIRLSDILLDENHFLRHEILGKLDPSYTTPNSEESL
jgi:hypothetical protein